MAEQLNKNDYLLHPDKIGALNYYSLGETTINQLQQNKLIRSKTKKHQSKKPDALVTNDRKDILVYVENKDIGEIDTEEQLTTAIEQQINVAKDTNSRIFVVTDTVKSYWINPLTGNYILDENGEVLSITFKPYENKKNLEKLIKRICNSIDKNCDQIKKINYLDPSSLARAIHQQIYIAKNSSPETCLYTFVELFIFKYLSDLRVLTGSHSFDFLYNMYSDDEITDEDVLAYYLGETGPRQKIKTLFPCGADGTTIVNGDVFHVVKDKDGNYEKNGDGKTFKNIIKEFKSYEKANGKFINIHRDFKSRLFESFLKNEKDKKSMGQFFTPLKVIEQMVRMCDITDGMKICDPACGVGKMLLEAIVNDIDRFYRFDGEKLVKNVELYGFDKISEDNSDRTIILAKANMLIYFSKLIAENTENNITTTFANEVLNSSFKIFKNNLGTLSECIYNKYDLILSNPPYIVNGSASIKEQALTTNFYNNQGLGVEALFMEWIINSLKEGGTGLVVIPDGLLSNISNTKLRKFILETCEINGIISLPINTFYGTPKKTFILSITKKVKGSNGKLKKQTNPVFSYICNSIGETLDVYRFETDENDLEEAVNQYRLFKACTDKSKFRAIKYNEDESIYEDGKFKLIPIETFVDKVEENWNIDKFWTDEEKVSLGFKKPSNVLTISEFESYIDVLLNDFEEYKEDLKCLK